MRELEFPAYPPVTGPRLRWSAIFAGAAVALAVLASLHTLGALGSSWAAIASGVAAYGAGGWFASRLSDSGRHADGVLYGLVAWAVVTLVMFYSPAFAARVMPPMAAYGTPVFLVVLCEAAAAAFGGAAGARLYLPVPIAEYRERRPGRPAPPPEEITPLRRQP